MFERMRTITARVAAALAAAACTIALCACRQIPGPVAPASGAPRASGPSSVDAARLIAADEEPQNWLSYGRDTGENRFSPLTSINERNVSRLGLAWFVDLGTKIGSETTPLVVDGVMYTVGAWNVIYALDAGTGRQRWRYDPKPRRDWMRYMCCGPAARGLAVWKGKVIAATIDGRLFAVDAQTGVPVWDVRTSPSMWPIRLRALRACSAEM
jgi:quinohemoprotein ethanol dehydrogenase